MRLLHIAIFFGAASCIIDFVTKIVKVWSIDCLGDDTDMLHFNSCQNTVVSML